VKIVQVHLSKETEHIVCWLPAEPKLKVGLILSIKGLEGKYTIKEVYSTVMDHFEINRKWDVGGL
jgi:hypothetical protein